MKKAIYETISSQNSSEQLKSPKNNTLWQNSSLKSQLRAIIIVLLGVIGLFIDKLPMIILIAYGFYELNNAREEQ